MQLLLLAALALAAPPRGPRARVLDPHQQALVRANTHLERGQWRIAEQKFRAILLDRPKSPFARVGLAQALSATSGCDEALELLESVRGKWVWKSDASLAEGRCYLQQGRPHEAIEAFEHAVHLNRNDAGAWFALAQTLGSLGREQRLEEALDGLRLCEGGYGLETLVRAEVALRDGDASVDGWIAQARDLFGYTPVLGIYDARAWMDQNDPAAAEAVLLDHLRHNAAHAQVAFWRGEALRRLGRTASADAVFRRRSFQWALDDALALALRARVFIDLGELERATELVQRLPDPIASEALATRWYLARARGDGWEADRLAVLWGRTESAAGRSLEQLVPLAEPDTVGIPATVVEDP